MTVTIRYYEAIAYAQNLRILQTSVPGNPAHLQGGSDVPPSHHFPPRPRADG